MESYIAILTAIVGALGVKEIWKIIKSRVDHSNTIDSKKVEFKHEMILQLQTDNKELQSRLDKQSARIVETEKKLTELLIINKQLRKTIEDCSLKMARMEERLLAKKKPTTKRGRPRKSTKSSSND